MKRAFSALAGWLLVAGSMSAETVKDREGAVRRDREERENDPRWIYNDVERGFEEARASGKPLMVVLRCVPCIACSGIDSQVLVENPAITPLLDRFVRVRVINANALDLGRFAFDYDLSFTTLFFNGDGTVYGRYGSWSHQRNGQDRATDGFRAALEAALSVHAGYPSNRDALAGKQPPAPAYRTPVEIPGLRGKYESFLNWSGKVVPSCVHCHQINDALRLTLRSENRTLPADLIYPMPPPETVGLELAPDRVARVVRVQPGSPASAAGFEPGDDLTALAGQPLVSAADVSWALHRHPDTGPITARCSGPAASGQSGWTCRPDGARGRTSPVGSEPGGCGRWRPAGFSWRMSGMPTGCASGWGWIPWRCGSCMPGSTASMRRRRRPASARGTSWWRSTGGPAA